MKNYIIPITLGILIIIILVEGYLLTRSGTANIKTDEKAIAQDKVQITKLAVRDTSLIHQIEVLTNLVKSHKQSIDFWMAKYTSTEKPTKTQIKEVFKNDSSTIANKVIKGVECDSLVRAQALVIKDFDKQNALMAEDIKVKASTIRFGMKVDSINRQIEKSLEKKIRNRTLGEIILGALAVLAIIFH